MMKPFKFENLPEIADGDDDDDDETESAEQPISSHRRMPDRPTHVRPGSAEK